MADPNRKTPYGAFNYLVTFDGDDKVFGGFSDVSGIGSEIKVAEYRNGNEKENHTRKVAGINTAADVTLKRGIVDSQELWKWIREARINGPAAQKNVTITLLDEAQNAVQSWLLQFAIPMKYTGPTLAGKGGGDVAMEEIVLSAESMELVP
jgi:phage tail-like protein